MLPSTQAHETLGIAMTSYKGTPLMLGPGMHNLRTDAGQLTEDGAEPPVEDVAFCVTLDKRAPPVFRIWSRNLDSPDDGSCTRRFL